MNDKWLTLDGSMARNFFDGTTIKVKTRMGGEVAGHLTVDGINDDQQIKLSAHYNSCPFEGPIVDEAFALTQERLNELLEKGGACVLVAPRKNPN